VKDRLFANVLNFWDQLKDQSNILFPCVCTRDDVADILYTSGTTGKPKGAMLTHYSVLFCSSLYTDNDDMREFMFPEDSKFLVTLPLYHCYGQNPCLLTPLSVGATVIILDKFNTDKVFHSIATHRATSFPGVPTMFAYLINGFDPKKHDVSSLKFCCSAGAPLPSEIAHAFYEKLGIEIINGYGITEASAQAIAHPLAPHKRRRDKCGSIGIPLKNSWQQTEVKIVDDNGQELPSNAIGELIIKGDHIMKGYWKSPELTASTIRDGWLYTGDLGRRDEDGYFYIVDRKKDMIIVGGENVYPREIEEILYQNEKILEAAVIGVPDAIKGEAVKAIVALHSGIRATEEELIKYCASRLAKFKVPKIIEIREDLPKSATGKILRRLLK
ncbi:long-chain fatty acid--CoA ligase, partial [bacterium]|nr:long-chain fatty acid--CoA ligase [bacterium]